MEPVQQVTGKLNLQVFPPCVDLLSKKQLSRNTVFTLHSGQFFDLLSNEIPAFWQITGKLNARGVSCFGQPIVLMCVHLIVTACAALVAVLCLAMSMIVSAPLTDLLSVWWAVCSVRERIFYS